MTENDHIIRRYVERQYAASKLPFTFPVEDITQEVRIKIWEKLIQDYDDRISAPRTFIIAYLPNTYRGIVYHMEACLKYTGNTDAHMTRGRRT